MNRDYAELLTLVGKAVAAATRSEHVLAAKQLQLFSIEFWPDGRGWRDEGIRGRHPLLDRRNPLFALLAQVTRRPFVTDVVIATDYDPSRMQDHLFIAPSFSFLRHELEGLVRRFGIPVL